MQDILKKCLEMLNSDISDTETQPQPDVDRDSMSSASSNFSIDIKAELGDQEKFDKLSVKTTSPLCEGLLKIASPVPPLPPAQPSVTKAHVTPPSPSPSPTPSSGPPSPGPPVLEPMTSLPRSAPSSSAAPAPAFTVAKTPISLPTVPLLPPSLSLSRPTLTSVTPAVTQPSCHSFPAPAPAAAANTAAVTQQPQLVAPVPAAAGNPIQQIILPPVQAGQQQQFILQPQQLAAAANTTITSNPTMVQAGQPGTPQPPIVQIVQAGVPLQYNSCPIPLLNPQGQLMATVGGVSNQTQLLSNLQNFVMMVQPTLPASLQPGMAATTTNLQPAGVSSPIIIKQEPMSTQPQLKPMVTSQPTQGLTMTNPLVNIAPAATNLVQQQPTFVTNNPASTPTFQTTTPIKLGAASLPTTPLISTQPNFNVVQTPSGQSFNIIQPQVSTPPQQQQAAILQNTTPSIVPTPNILQPQSNAMNIIANNSTQVTASSTISNLLPTTPAPQQNIISLPQQPQPPTSTTTTTHNNNSNNTVQLVQDPNTGLYNLVQQPQPATATQLVTQNTSIGNSSISSNNPTTTTAVAPKLLMANPINPVPQQQPLASISESPKRSATPILAKGSPLKVPKLLLPSLPGTKENKPTPDPPTKQFMCGVCNKYFGNQKNLRVHISEIHEGKRGQFPCDICHKVFPRKRNMERHKNALHLKNSPQCYLCHKSVVNLDMHIKRFHKGSTEIKIKVEETSA